MSGYGARAIVSGLLVWCVVGCGSPPAVTPLMRVVGEALEAEAALVELDAARYAAWGAEQRAMLRQGFESDIAAREALDAEWVREHVRVYVTARELLAASGEKMRASMVRRRENLAAAGEAQRRAIELIEQQDVLMERVPDLRRWVLEQAVD